MLDDLYEKIEQTLKRTSEDMQEYVEEKQYEKEIVKKTAVQQTAEERERGRYIYKTFRIN